jgi:hypothetical protein
VERAIIGMEQSMDGVEGRLLGKMESRFLESEREDLWEVEVGRLL